MGTFKGQNLLAFSDRFKTDLVCKEYLAETKCGTGYKCRKCGHAKYQVRKDLSRTCNICSDIESPYAGTLFHRVKFGLRKAFLICFETSTTTKSLSASYTAVRYGVAENTARLFMHKVREAMRRSGDHPMDGYVHVDEFFVGKENGKVGRDYSSKKKKVACAVQLTKDGKVKRFYALVIRDFSARSLRGIFDSYISSDAHVTADEWRDYRPISGNFQITQIPSNGGHNFKALHTMIHQGKSWIKTTYSWVSKKHIIRYLNEFSYRLNTS